MTDNDKSALKYGLFFLGGAAVGAGIALLFAPRPGKETRELVGKWVRKKSDEGRDLLEKGKEEFAVQKEKLGAALTAGRKAYGEPVNGHRTEPAKV